MDIYIAKYVGDETFIYRLSEAQNYCFDKFGANYEKMLDIFKEKNIPCGTFKDVIKLDGKQVEGYFKIEFN